MLGAFFDPEFFVARLARKRAYSLLPCSPAVPTHVKICVDAEFRHSDSKCVEIAIGRYGYSLWHRAAVGLTS